MAITLPHIVPMGNGVTRYLGTFAHTVGAAEETFKVCGRVHEVLVSSQDSGAKAVPLTSVDFTESVSGSTNTVTVHHLGAVTTGRISVLAKA